MSLVPERDAFKGSRRGLINEEVLHGKLSAPSTKGESQESNDTESLVHRELPSAHSIEEAPSSRSYDSSPAALGVEELRISPERVEAFKRLYSKRFGKQIDENEAVEKGRQLLRLMELIYVPMRRSELIAVEEHNRELGIVRRLPPPV